MVACGTLWWFAVVCGGLSILIDVIPRHKFILLYTGYHTAGVTN